MVAKKTTEVSGWYAKGKPSLAEKAEHQRRVDEWFRKRIDQNYRQIAVEAPGPMILALGKLAQDSGTPFGEFVEGILAEYLERSGVGWRR